MLIIVGTLPDPQAPILEGPVEMGAHGLRLGGREIDPDRGTPALLGAAALACEFLGLAAPHAFLVGDEGLGRGSRALYARLVDILPQRRCSTLVFHYLQPDVDWHNKVLFAAQAMPGAPKLIADAGFMYAAKMSGQAPAYDLFTPDAGELAFLADEDAPHPFYTRGFILHDENKVPELAARAYAHGNAASCLMIKGGTDHVAGPQGILGTVAEPSEEAMEAMGGTGDTLTGLVSALVESGLDIAEAALLAARANRLAGQLTAPHPGTQIRELLPHLPRALEQALSFSESA